MTRDMQDRALLIAFFDCVDNNDIEKQKDGKGWEVVDNYMKAIGRKPKVDIQKRLQIEFEFLGEEQISGNTALNIVNNVFTEVKNEKICIQKKKSKKLIK